MRDIVERMRDPLKNKDEFYIDVKEAADEIERLRTEALNRDCSEGSEYQQAILKDAERYRHAEAHGWPIRAPLFMAWTRNGAMRFGDTKESALDAAMQGSELVRPNVRAKLATTACHAGRQAQNGPQAQRLTASVPRRWRSA